MSADQSRIFPPQTLRGVEDDDPVLVTKAEVDREVVEQSVYLSDIRTGEGQLLSDPAAVDPLLTNISAQIESRLPDLASALGRFITHHQVEGATNDGATVSLPGVTIEVVARIRGHQAAIPVEMPEEVREHVVTRLQSGANLWPVEVSWVDGVGVEAPEEG